MRIGIAGHFGFGNLGDELFLTQWQHLFQGRAEVLPVCLDAELDFDKIIVGGGDLAHLGNVWGCCDNFWNFRLLDKPCYVYSVGCFQNEPNKEACDHLAQFTQGCQEVHIRDEWSVEALKAIGCKVTHQCKDLLWNIHLPDFCPHEADWQDCLGLALREEYPITAPQIDSVFTEAHSRGLGVKALPQQSQTFLGSDYQLHLDLMPRCNGWIRPEANAIYRANACGWCKVLVSTRIHATILAALQNTPVIPIYVEGKNRFSYVCQQLGIKGINKQDWTQQDFTEALDTAVNMDWQPVWQRVAAIREQAAIEQQAFVEQICKS